MRRMLIGSYLNTPIERNKVFCSQFVADEIVLTNIEEGLYLISLKQIGGDAVSYPAIILDFKFESTYGSFYTPFYYDINGDRIFALKGEYSGNSKTMTLSLIDTLGNTIQSPTNFHIDIYDIGGE